MTRIRKKKERNLRIPSRRLCSQFFSRYFWGIGIFRSSFRYRDLLDLQFTGCRGTKKSTHRLIPGRRQSRCWTTECRISMPKKRSRYQKGDLGHLDTTKKTSRYQKKTHPKTEPAPNPGTHQSPVEGLSESGNRWIRCCYTTCLL